MKRLSLALSLSLFLGLAFKATLSIFVSFLASLLAGFRKMSCRKKFVRRFGVTRDYWKNWFDRGGERRRGGEEERRDEERMRV